MHRQKERHCRGVPAGPAGGSAADTGLPGRYGSAPVRLQILIPGSEPARWVETNVEWTADGVQQFWLSSGNVYRMMNDPAGGEAWLSDLQYQTLAGRA